MRYLTPAVLLLAGCVSSQSLTDIRGDDDAVTVSHDRAPEAMSQCIRGRLAVTTGTHLKGAQPTATSYDGGASVVGRNPNGFFYAIDIDDASALVSVNRALIAGDQTRAKLADITKGCAAG